MDGAEFIGALLTFGLCIFYIFFTIWFCKFLIKVPEYLNRSAEAQERIAGALERKEQRELFDRNAARQTAPRPTAPQTTIPQNTQPQQ